MALQSDLVAAKHIVVLKIGPCMHVSREWRSHQTYNELGSLNASTKVPGVYIKAKSNLTEEDFKEVKQKPS